MDAVLILTLLAGALLAVAVYAPARAIPTRVTIMCRLCISEKQIDPFGEKYSDAFQILEDMFNWIFLVELVVNMYAHWYENLLRQSLS